MAKFANLTFTSQGTQILVQAQNSHTLTFTCGKLGSGVLADSDDISKFTDLKSPKMTLPIVSVDDSNEEKLVLTFDTSNTELEEGFVSREIGIFAKLDNGAETLYAYSNAGNNYDYIPSKDTPSDENRLVVNLVVSSSANISVQIDKSIVYSHKSDVEEMIATHDASDTAHETRFKLFEKIADFGNDIIKKLALTTAITAITALETGSWFGQLLKMVLTASGVKYNIAQNGYVCLGSFFGGLIIQWGSFYNVNGLSPIIYPIALSSKPWAIIPTEGDPAGWNTSNGIAIAGGDIKTASNTQANILSKWVLNGGTVEQGGQSVLVLIIGV